MLLETTLMEWEWLIDTIGWIGSIEVVVAYGLVSYNKIEAESLGYQILNLTGGLFLIINTYYYAAYPSTFINVVWLFIALFAIIKMFRKPKK